MIHKTATDFVFLIVRCSQYFLDKNFTMSQILQFCVITPAMVICFISDYFSPVKLHSVNFKQQIYHVSKPTHGSYLSADGYQADWNIFSDLEKTSL